MDSNEQRNERDGEELGGPHCMCDTDSLVWGRGGGVRSIAFVKSTCLPSFFTICLLRLHRDEAVGIIIISWTENSGTAHVQRRLWYRSCLSSVVKRRPQ